MVKRCSNRQPLLFMMNRLCSPGLILIKLGLSLKSFESVESRANIRLSFTDGSTKVTRIEFERRLLSLHEYTGSTKAPMFSSITVTCAMVEDEQFPFV